MTFASSFGRVLSPTFQPKSQAVGGKWWLAGNINPANCVAAYQPKGAASYAASLIDLSGSGHNATKAPNDPDWDATNGWTFDIANSERLSTGVPVNSGYSAIVRFTGAGDGLRSVFGAYYAAGGIYGSYDIVPNRYSKVYYCNTSVAPQCVNGVLALAGNKGYRNGTKETESASPKDTYIYPLCIGASSNAGNYYQGWSGSVQSFSLYNVILTDIQVALVSTAMAAL